MKLSLSSPDMFWSAVRMQSLADEETRAHAGLKSCAMFSENFNLSSDVASLMVNGGGLSVLLEDPDWEVTVCPEM